MLTAQQSRAAPTTKTAAGGIAGAVVVVIVWLLHEYAGVNMPGEVGAALTVIISFATSYMTAPRWKDQVVPAQFKPEPPQA